MGAILHAPIREERQVKALGGFFADECPLNVLAVKRTLGERLSLEHHDFVVAIVRGVDAGLGAKFASAKHRSSDIAAVHIPSQDAEIGAQPTSRPRREGQPGTGALILDRGESAPTRNYIPEFDGDEGKATPGPVDRPAERVKKRKRTITAKTITTFRIIHLHLKLCA